MRKLSVHRAESADLQTGCVGNDSTPPLWSDPAQPTPGQQFYYVVRSVAPNPGSAGTDSEGIEREVLSCFRATGTLDVAQPEPAERRREAR